MKVKKFTLGELQTNCYFLVEDNKTIIIDPADEANFILDKILQEKLEPLALLASHGHFDHTMAAGEIQLSFNIPFYIDKKDLFLIERVEETAEYFLGYKPAVIKPKRIKFLKEGFMKIGPFEFEVIKTPGHTPGSCCFYFKKQKLAFPGDTIFKDGIGRYDFSYSSKIDLFESIKKLQKLPKQTTFFPGHGEEFKLTF